MLDKHGNIGLGAGYQGELTGSPPVWGMTITKPGTIHSNGDAWFIRSDGETPVVFRLGRQDPHQAPENVPPHHNYLFRQSRLNQNGWYWGGWNSFRHPLTVPAHVTGVPTARGYGYYPLRSYSKNFVLQPDGAIVSDLAAYAPIMYFQAPLHADFSAPVGSPDVNYFVTPSGYDSDRHPYKDLGATSQTDGAIAAGTSVVKVNDVSGFAVNDEVLIEESPSKSEINQIAGINAGTRELTLVRDHKAYASGSAVKKVEELGGVAPGTSSAGQSVYIRRVGTELWFKDSSGAEISLAQLRGS